MSSLIASMLAVAAVSAVMAPVRVELEHSVRVSGAHVRLGDIVQVAQGEDACVNALRALDLGAAPTPGATVVLRRWEIEALVEQQLQSSSRCSWRFEGAAEVVLASNAESVETAALVHQTGDALEAALAATFDEVHVEAVSTDSRPLNVLPGTTFEILPIDASQPRERMVVSVAVHEPDHAAWNTAFWFDVRATHMAWQLDEGVDAGRELAGARKHLAKVNVAALAHKVVASDFDFNGWVAKRALPVGAVLEADGLMAEPDVVAGNAVALRFHSGGLEVQTAALALQSGFKGDRVLVKNTRSDEEVAGRVDGRNDVEVLP